MKSGYILLSQMRSGTTWLCSLANSTNVMGKARESLRGGREFKNAEDHFSDVIDSASTDNGIFGLKIFPDQLNRIHLLHGYDFIRRCSDRYNTCIVVLERGDVLRHAISIVRYRQARKLGEKSPTVREPKYDFGQLCTAIESIEYNNAFWRAYLRLNGLNHRVFLYEDLLDDKSPYFTHLDKALALPSQLDLTTDRRIIRDELTDEWVERFTEETTTTGAFPSLFRPGTTPRTPGNLSRFLRGKPMI